MNAWSRGSVLKCFVDFKIEDISKAVASIFSKKKKKKKNNLWWYFEISKPFEVAKV